MISFPESVILNRVDDETVLLDTKSGTYYQLNATATDMVELLREGASRSNVVARLGEKYNIDEERLRTDLDTLVAQLKERGLVNGDGDES